MNRYVKAFVGVSLLAMPLSGLAVSVDHCDEPTPVDVYRDNKLYGFSSKVSCYLTVDDDADLQAVVADYETYLQTSPSYQLHGSRQPLSSGGLVGSKFTGSESMVTEGHGSLDMDVVVKILANDSDRFVYESATSKIKGTGNAAYTKSRKVSVQARKKGQRVKVNATLDVLIQKPSMAFIESLFTNPASQGVQDQVSELARDHAERIAATFSR